MFRVITTKQIGTTRTTTAWVATAGYQTRFEARGRTQQEAIDNLNELMADFDTATRKITRTKSPYLWTESEIRRIAEQRQQHSYHMKRKCKHGHQFKRWTKTGRCIECYPERP